MENIEYKAENGTLTIYLKGHIDSANAPAVEKEINDILAANPGTDTVIDADSLRYISSAGLRVVLRMRKAIPALKIINVSPEVFEIFDMTGFTEMMDIQKAYRIVSVEGCEVIGQGANGRVYRIDPDTIVKVYLNPDALPEIHRERELARTAFVLGIPTAIPYDVVRIEGGGYGSVFELLNAKSFAKLLISGEKTVDEIAEMSISLLKQIHATEVKPDTMPSMKDVAMGWVKFVKDYIPADQYEKLYSLMSAVPEDHHMMHGDYHLKNVMLQNGETLLIDMDTLCWGHPVFEISDMFNAYLGYSEANHDVIRDFLGITHETALELWNKSMKLYFDGADDETINAIVDKARIISYVRILRRSVRRTGLDTAQGRMDFDNCRARLAELLPKVDTLVF